ncbi:hypothetical protein MRB53_039228 [Persea americana]|nr:hypothetical protein MRB53_039228 [Persea americana]
MSTSSIAYTPLVPELNGRKSPEKGHSRAWSQDTVTRPIHSRGPGLEPVDETSASIISTDSAPKTPSSTIGSPLSGTIGVGATSPSIGSRPTLVAKRSLLSRKAKWRPNAVSENLEQVPAMESAKDADFCGWLRKRR